MRYRVFKTNIKTGYMYNVYELCGTESYSRMRVIEGKNYRQLKCDAGSLNEQMAYELILLHYPEAKDGVRLRGVIYLQDKLILGIETRIEATPKKQNKSPIKKQAPKKW